jgi:NADP-dependent 3-hydroxy acid dehydrogenase YdfG
VIAARTEADLDRTGEHIKKISPKTQVVKVVTDVSDKSSVENLFKEAFKRFPEVDVSDMMLGCWKLDFLWQNQILILGVEPGMLISK